MVVYPGISHVLPLGDHSLYSHYFPACCQAPLYVPTSLIRNPLFLTSSILDHFSHSSLSPPSSYVSPPSSRSFAFPPIRLISRHPLQKLCLLMSFGSAVVLLPNSPYFVLSRLVLIKVNFPSMLTGSHFIVAHA